MVLRSIVYNVVFLVLILSMMILLSPVLLFGQRAEMAIVRLWSRLSMWLHTAVTGVRHEYRHFDRLPPGGCIVAAKHQSTWETIALIPFFRHPAFILKRELIWLPFFGWWAWRAGMIPVDRGKGSQALIDMVAKARAATDAGREIVIFPEGTRREAGDEPRYKIGIAHLYRDLGVPVVPIALNSGVYWPRRSIVQRPGTIVAEMLEPIPPGLDPREMFRRLQEDLEAACDRLLVEAAEAGADLPPLAAARVAALRAGTVSPAA